MNRTLDLPINKRRRQLNKQQNRDSIILASRKVFTEKGLDSSNVREIVSEPKRPAENMIPIRFVPKIYRD